MSIKHKYLEYQFFFTTTGYLHICLLLLHVYAKTERNERRKIQINK